MNLTCKLYYIYIYTPGAHQRLIHSIDIISQLIMYVLNIYNLHTSELLWIYYHDTEFRLYVNLDFMWIQM